MFKNLLDPNSEKALSKALETLDQNIADQRQALVHLIISNQDKLVDSTQIEEINELYTLFDLFNQSESRLKERIEILLSRKLSSQILSNDTSENTKANELLDKATNTNQQDTIYIIASLSDDNKLCSKALEKLSLSKKEQLLYDSKNDIIKKLIIENIDNIETLKRLEKEIKGKDKKIYRSLQDKIETIEILANQKKVLIEKTTNILSSLDKLSKTSYAPLYDSKFKHIETEWRDLQSEIQFSSFSLEEISNESPSINFEETAAICKKVITDVQDNEKKEQNKEQNKAFLNKSLTNLKAFLSAETIDNDACSELINSINNKIKDQNKDDKELEFDNKTFSIYENVFNFHKELKNKKSEIEGIEQKLTDFKELFSSNHKKKKAENTTLSEINNQLASIDNLKKSYPENNGILEFEIESIKYLNEKTNELKKYEQSCLEMQREFQAKFDKKLGYVKTEIENKALTTVIRLCKEAKELLPYCPEKQQEKLQKRLDIFKEEIIKLEDWYNFATLPKRKELCEHMDELAKNAPRTKIRVLKEEIKKLQQEWKSLGHARDKEGEALWEHFQDAGNLAYQPIKDLLDRKDQEKQTNLETRQQIIQKLNNHIQTYYSEGGQRNQQDNDSQSSEKLLRQSQSNWNKAFPIPAGHQALQSEFEKSIQLLAEKLIPIRSINLGKKNTLLSQAEKLTSHENISEAIEQAKKLQLDWKDVGYCENDDELWGKFRSFCDQIFSTRNSLRDEQKDKENRSISEAKKLCKTIETLDRDEINQFESELRKLCSQFEDIKDLPKQRKDLQSQFSKAKKTARARLEQLKKNHKSEVFQNIINICENLGKIEKRIIKNDISSDEVNEDFESICINNNCPSESKEHLKNSLLTLLKESNNDIDSYINLQKHALRQLCVELEIELEIDSPPQDKALRMELQVKRLNKKFNQSKKDLSISDRILSAFYLGGLNSFQDTGYVNRLIAMQEKTL